MNKEIIYGTQGGFPWEQDILDLHQQAYSETFSALEGLIGDKTIIKGKLTTGGWMYINGEILPFEQVPDGQQTFYINEERVKLMFDNGDENDVEKYRSIRNGQGSHFYYWKDVREFDGDIVAVWENFKKYILLTDRGGSDNERAVCELIDEKVPVERLPFMTTSLTPAGSIMMFHGTTAPAGWKLCDGVNTYKNAQGNTVTTPNLKGRFIVGYDPDDADYNNINKFGGAKQVTLTTAQMPSHTHSIDSSVLCKKDNTNNVGTANNGRWTYDTVGNMGRGETTASGNGQSHENRPPYYVLAYIIKDGQ